MTTLPVLLLVVIMTISTALALKTWKISVVAQGRMSSLYPLSQLSLGLLQDDSADNHPDMNDKGSHVKDVENEHHHDHQAYRTILDKPTPLIRVQLVIVGTAGGCGVGGCARNETSSPKNANENTSHENNDNDDVDADQFSGRQGFYGENESLCASSWGLSGLLDAGVEIVCLREVHHIGHSLGEDTQQRQQRADNEEHASSGVLGSNTTPARGSGQSSGGGELPRGGRIGVGGDYGHAVVQSRNDRYGGTEALMGYHLEAYGTSFDSLLALYNGTTCPDDVSALHGSHQSQGDAATTASESAVATPSHGSTMATKNFEAATPLDEFDEFYLAEELEKEQVESASRSQPDLDFSEQASLSSAAVPTDSCRARPGFHPHIVISDGRNPWASDVAASLGATSIVVHVEDASLSEILLMLSLSPPSPKGGDTPFPSAAPWLQLKHHSDLDFVRSLHSSRVLGCLDGLHPPPLSSPRASSPRKSTSAMMTKSAGGDVEDSERKSKSKSFMGQRFYSVKQVAGGGVSGLAADEDVGDDVRSESSSWRNVKPQKCDVVHNPHVGGIAPGKTTTDALQTLIDKEMAVQAQVQRAVKERAARAYERLHGVQVCEGNIRFSRAEMYSLGEAEANNFVTNGDTGTTVAGHVTVDDQHENRSEECRNITFDVAISLIPPYRANVVTWTFSEEEDDPVRLTSVGVDLPDSFVEPIIAASRGGEGHSTANSKIFLAERKQGLNTAATSWERFLSWAWGVMERGKLSSIRHRLDNLRRQKRSVLVHSRWQKHLRRSLVLVTGSEVEEVLRPDLAPGWRTPSVRHVGELRLGDDDDGASITSSFQGSAASGAEGELSEKARLLSFLNSVARERQQRNNDDNDIATVSEGPVVCLLDLSEEATEMRIIPPVKELLASVVGLLQFEPTSSPLLFQADHSTTASPVVDAVVWICRCEEEWNALAKLFEERPDLAARIHAIRAFFSTKQQHPSFTTTTTTTLLPTTTLSHPSVKVAVLGCGRNGPGSVADAYRNGVAVACVPITTDQVAVAGMVCDYGAGLACTTAVRTQPRTIDEEEKQKQREKHEEEEKAPPPPPLSSSTKTTPPPPSSLSSSSSGIALAVSGECVHVAVETIVRVPSFSRMAHKAGEHFERLATNNRGGGAGSSGVKKAVELIFDTAILGMDDWVFSHHERDDDDRLGKIRWGGYDVSFALTLSALFSVVWAMMVLNKLTNDGRYWKRWKDYAKFVHDTFLAS